MNHLAMSLKLADAILDLTDPKITRWAREQREIQARVMAKNYIKKLKEGS